MKVIESKDGVIQINGLLISDNSVNLWIDSESYLIKKIAINTMSDNLESATSITYNPDINVDIDDKKLEFDRWMETMELEGHNT